jgi:plastocyanin
MKRLMMLLALAACGGDDGGSMQTADAMGSGSGSGSNKVMSVTCPTTADAMVTVSAGGGSYSPMTQNVPVNAVVKFVMTPTHDAKPNTQGMTDPGLTVGFGETKCLKFTQAGTYGFFCSAHGFNGTITVQ